MALKSKKQQMNYKVFQLLIEWLDSILPENEVSIPEKINMIPKEQYFSVMGQRRLNAYTYRWMRKKIKTVLKKNKKKSILSVTLSDVNNA